MLFTAYHFVAILQIKLPWSYSVYLEFDTIFRSFRHLLLGIILMTLTCSSSIMRKLLKNNVMHFANILKRKLNDNTYNHKKPQLELTLGQLKKCTKRHSS